MAGKIIDATLRFVDKFTSPMGKAIQTMERSSKQAKRMGKDIQKVGKNIEKTGKTMTAGLTLPIVAIGTAALNTSMEFEAQMSRVQAIAEASSDELAILNQKAIDLGASTVFSASEVAEGMENMASAGFTTSEIMESMAGMLDLAASGGEGLALSAEIAASTVRGFRLEASETGHVADVLALTASRTNAQIADTGEAMKYAAPVASALGLSLEETAASIGIMSDAGIKGSQAGTTIRGALTRMVKPTKMVRDAMAELDLEFFDSAGNMKSMSEITDDLRVKTKDLTEEEKNNALARIFGTESLSGMLALVNAAPNQLEDLTSALKDSDGAAGQMAETMMDNGKGAIEEMGGALETASITIGTMLIPWITKGANKVAELANKFTLLTTDQQKTIIKIAGVVAVMGPFLIILGKVTQGIGRMISNTGKIVKFLKLFTIENIKATAVKVKDSVVTGINTAKLVANKVALAGLKAMQFASTAVTTGLTAAQWLLNAAFIASPIGWVVLGIGALIAVGVLLWKNWDTVREKAGELWEGIQSIFGGIGGWFRGIWDGVETGFKGFINFIIGGLNKIPEGLSKLNVTIPSWVPGVGGKSLGFSVPSIPMLARGTKDWGGGAAMVHDKGAEIIDLPRGSRVYPHDKSLQMARGEGAKSNNKTTFSIAKLADTIIIREDADIDRIAKELANELERVNSNKGKVVIA